MIDTSKLIFCILALLVIGVGIYFVVRKSKSGSGGGSAGIDCSHCGNLACNPDTGECFSIDKCNNIPKPDDTTACKNVCVRNKWICDRTDPCEKNTLPVDIGSCSLDTLVCDPILKQLYCPNSKTCNNNSQYFDSSNGVSRCACPAGELGKSCQYTNAKTCNGNGTVSVDKYDNATCVCDKTHYEKDCGQVCDPKKIYDPSNSKCICDPVLYTEQDGACTSKPCSNGTVDATTGNCDCNEGFTQSTDKKSCVSICTPGMIYNKGQQKCLQPSNCHIVDTESTYDTDGKLVKCDCTKDIGSCGAQCQYTRSDTCSGNGTPSCTGGTYTGCVCDKGYAGDDCSCTDNMPKDGNTCLGSSYTCKGGSWTSTFKTCNNIKAQYSGIDGWNTACFNTLSGGDYYSGAIVDCEDNLGKPVTPVFKGCLTPTNNTCNTTQVNMCDASTTYNWLCKDQVTADGKCPPPPIGIYCLDKDGKKDTPTCFKCGPTGGAEWVCKNEGASPSKKCLENLGIIGNTYTGVSELIYVNSQTGQPVYPTTDVNLCEAIVDGASKTDPFFNGQIGDYNVTDLFPNPSKYSINQKTAMTTHLEDPSLRYFLPGNEAERSDNVRCPLPDDQIIKYITKGTTGSTLCNGGTFVQDKDSKGNLLPSGNCTCLSKYKGLNCEKIIRNATGVHCDTNTDCITNVCGIRTGDPHPQCCYEGERTYMNIPGGICYSDISPHPP